MAAYRWVYGYHLQANCLESGISFGPNACIEYLLGPAASYSYLYVLVYT